MVWADAWRFLPWSVASAAPPVRYPSVYGIDLPATSELIANGRDVDEIRKIIGADRLIYQDLHGLIRSVRHDNSDITEFDTSCFSGEYVTGDITKEYLSKLERVRSDQAKTMRKARQNSFADLDIVEVNEQEASAGTDEEQMSDPAAAVGM